VVQRIFHIIPQTPCTRVSTFPPKPTGHLEQSAAVHSSSREISLSSRVSLRSYYRGFQAHCEASLTPTLYGITARSSRQVRVQFRAGKTFGFSPMSQSSSHPCTQHGFVYTSSSIILASRSLLPPPKHHLQGLKLEAHRFSQLLVPPPSVVTCALRMKLCLVQRTLAVHGVCIKCDASPSVPCLVPFFCRSRDAGLARRTPYLFRLLKGCSQDALSS